MVLASAALETLEAECRFGAGADHESRRLYAGDAAGTRHVCSRGAFRTSTKPPIAGCPEAQESIDAEEYAEAMDVLNTMVSRPRARFNGNERAQFHNMLAYANYELDNVEATIHHYEQVLAQMPDISEGMEITTLNQISKLYFQEGMKYEGAEARPWFDKALETMEEWMRKSHNPGPDAHFYIAQIYYQMQDFDRAIERLEMVVKVARDRCQQVRENWWTMLQFLYFEKENWPKVVEILEILCARVPEARLLGESGLGVRRNRPDGQAAVDDGSSPHRRLSRHGIGHPHLQRAAAAERHPESRLQVSAAGHRRQGPWNRRCAT